MLTAILLLSLLSIKDELVGMVDLYSTLQGNLVVYGINAFVTTVSAMLEIRYISVYEGTWLQYSIIVVIVGIVSALGGSIIVMNKKKLKELLRKKKISKSLKKHWELKKQEVSSENTQSNTAGTVQDNGQESKTVIRTVDSTGEHTEPVDRDQQ